VKGYSVKEIFSWQEQETLKMATKMVESLDEQSIKGEIRCHELARAVGKLLGLEHCDGFYGFVDHTWLWTKPLDPARVITPRMYFPNILDVYSVGSLPQVRLVDCNHTSLPHIGWGYRPGIKREDINEDLVSVLVKEIMRGPA
jgi:hypothetical protein